jgi:hypothetical protein
MTPREAARIVDVHYLVELLDAADTNTREVARSEVRYRLRKYGQARALFDRPAYAETEALVAPPLLVTPTEKPVSRTTPGENDHSVFGTLERTYQRRETEIASYLKECEAEAAGAGNAYFPAKLPKAVLWRNNDVVVIMDNDDLLASKLQTRFDDLRHAGRAETLCRDGRLFLEPSGTYRLEYVTVDDPQADLFTVHQHLYRNGCEYVSGRRLTRKPRPGNTDGYSYHVEADEGVSPDVDREFPNLERAVEYCKLNPVPEALLKVRQVLESGRR